MNTEELLNNFINISADINKEAKEFLSLSYNQINWKPSASQWSVAECFEHLFRTNKEFISLLQEFSTDVQTKNKSEIYKHSIIGKLLIKAMKPGNKIKMKTPAYFNPIKTNIREDIVKEFLIQNNILVGLIGSFGPSELEAKIKSPFSKFIKYKIGDALMIIANHNQRHLQQARRVILNKKFY